MWCQLAEGFMRQFLLLISFPYLEQLARCLGDGLSQFRDYVSYPTPQVTLQSFELFQLARLPIAKIIQSNIYIYYYYYYHYLQIFKHGNI